VWAQEHPAHGALHGAFAGAVQIVLGGLKKVLNMGVAQRTLCNTSPCSRIPRESTAVGDEAGAAASLTAFAGSAIDPRHCTAARKAAVTRWRDWRAVKAEQKRKSKRKGVK
jgi:hypothetical protein